jgi:hypothetical protein
MHLIVLNIYMLLLLHSIWLFCCTTVIRYSTVVLVMISLTTVVMDKHWLFEHPGHTQRSQLAPKAPSQAVVRMWPTLVNQEPASDPERSKEWNGGICERGQELPLQHFSSSSQEERSHWRAVCCILTEHDDFNSCKQVLYFCANLLYVLVQYISLIYCGDINLPMWS